MIDAGQPEKPSNGLGRVCCEAGLFEIELEMFV